MKESYSFLILAPWMAFAACWWRAGLSPARARLAWRMVSVGVLLWAVGMSLAAWEDLAEHVPMSVAYFSDFSYFLYSVPILLVISWPTESERVPLFLWLDGLQAVMTACLVYVMLFSVFPFTRQQSQPLSAPLLAVTYAIENLVLALAATLRLLTSSGTEEERRFYQVLTGFLWMYAACAGWYNHKVLVLSAHMGLYDLLPTLPYLLLAASALVLPVHEPVRERTPRGSLLAQLIDNGSPVFYTLAMLAPSIFLVWRHFLLGIISMVIGLIIYVVRVTVLQNYYMSSQRALRKARDELEEISLRDALTGVANRRCFDQTLEREWSLAIRSGRALSLLMIDLDHFKRLNDSQGHRAGDACLVQVAGALRSVLPRKGDLLARYGGEEFAAIMVGTDRAGAEIVAAGMLESVRALGIENETTDGIATVSIGIATVVPVLGETAEVLVEASDRALYLAKENGRNRLECILG